MEGSREMIIDDPYKNATKVKCLQPAIKQFPRTVSVLLWIFASVFVSVFISMFVSVFISVGPVLETSNHTVSKDSVEKRSEAKRMGKII